MKETIYNNLLKSINITTARKINEQKARLLKAIPFKENEKEVYVYCSEVNEKIEDDMLFIFRKKVIITLIKEEEILYLIKIAYLGQKKEAYDIIIKEAIEFNVSDIHYEPYKDKVVVRFRIDGLLRPMYIFNKEEYQLILSKIKLNSNMDITEKRKPQDGKISFEYNKKSYDLRISTMPAIFGEKVVIRILYGNVFNYSIDKLNLTSEQKDKLKYIMKVNSGLTIVNGPTGSGKSTTLYSILQELNKDQVNISSLEDPIEAIIPGINQMNLNKTLNIGFAEGLRCFLRQDPDIIMMGEIRDEETAEMSVRAALTGHKVYSTIHTRDPREVYFRLEDMKVEKYLIRDSLVGIVSQRLIRLLCDNCKTIIDEKDIDGEVIKIYEKCGCNECNFTGYKGRSLVAAVHVIDNDMKEKIKNINNDNNLLSNSEMVKNLKTLLINGNISLRDYENFIEVEGLSFEYEK
ncbi:GspE/PulE family protein [Clostridium sp. 1001271B_151109_B4]|uniref:GspE/PulE family protein n=1 Tax=Clostridium sp. 1001271B_151109_B4 TaxID=2787148 RepID=UPI0018AB025C|nr:GspE/PulE family protein [Clostridium sp. 1001271B_151109_B4]